VWDLIAQEGLGRFSSSSLMRVRVTRSVWM